MFLLDRALRWVLNRYEELRINYPAILDYGICLRNAYVVVEGPRGREMGVAATLLEDVSGSPRQKTRPPAVEEIEHLISSMNPLERALGVALLNAISAYLLWRFELRGNVQFVDPFEYLEFLKEPVLVIGNMSPVRRLLEERGILSTASRRKTL